MATKASKDTYANKMYGAVTESAANTLTFAEINTNVSVYDKAAFVLHRLEWFVPYTTHDQLVAQGDKFELALTASQQISSLGLNNPAVIDLLELNVNFKTGVGYETLFEPIIRDFTTLPGGGLIIAPRPLFMAIKGTSVAAAGSCQLRVYFTVKTLSADEYLELVDFYRIVGV